MTVRVVIVDDRALVRAGFRTVLDSQPDLEVVGEAIDGADALRVLEPVGGTDAGEPGREPRERARRRRTVPASTGGRTDPEI